MQYLDGVDFELGENVPNLDLDLKWSQANIDGRRHISDREALRSHAPQFMNGIYYFRIIEWMIDEMINPNTKGSYLYRLNENCLRLIVDYAFPGQGQLVTDSIARRQLKLGSVELPFRLCVRKRPMFSYETNAGYYDSVQANYNHLSPAASGKCPQLPPTVVTHDGRCARNGRVLTINHRSYKFHRVFDENASNQKICETEIDPLLNRAINGDFSTLILFGQTGTGKTYTLSGALDYTCSKLKGEKLHVIFYEIHGKKCYDLLNDRKVVHLRSDEKEKVHCRGARKVEIDDSDPELLVSTLQMALKLRSSEVTERNPISSRSHAICCISILNVDSDVVKGGVTFVDLAGSERNYDTIKMSAAAHRESADINSALMALKSCFQSYFYAMAGESQRREIDMLRDGKTGLINYKKIIHLRPVAKAPYRASLLTRVLRECFEHSSEQKRLTTIITTVSPSSSDIQHTINSLDHASMMIPHMYDKIACSLVEVPMAGAPLSHIPVESWTAEQVSLWAASAEGGKFNQLALPQNLNGADLINMDFKSISALFAGTLREARVDGEGSAWVVGTEAEAAEGVPEDASKKMGRILARAFMASLKREQQFASVRSKGVLV